MRLLVAFLLVALAAPAARADPDVELSPAQASALAQTVDAQSKPSGTGPITKAECPTYGSWDERSGKCKTRSNLNDSRQAVPAATAQNLRLAFLLGSAQLTRVSMRNLDRLAAAFTASYDRARFYIDGHTDRSGSCSVNAKLSKDRAESTVAYLAGKGVARSRMLARGFGYAQPVAGADPASPINRRVEIVAQQPGAPQAKVPAC